MDNDWRIQEMKKMMSPRIYTCDSARSVPIRLYVGLLPFSACRAIRLLVRSLKTVSPLVTPLLQRHRYVRSSLGIYFAFSLFMFGGPVVVGIFCTSTIQRTQSLCTWTDRNDRTGIAVAACRVQTLVYAVKLQVEHILYTPLPKWHSFTPSPMPCKCRCRVYLLSCRLPWHRTVCKVIVTAEPPQLATVVVW